MTNKPLLQDIEDALEDASSYIDPYDDRFDKLLARVRELRESVDIEALDEALKIENEYDGIHVDNLMYAYLKKYNSYPDDFIEEAATKLREIVGE